MSLDVVRPARSFPPSASFAFNFALKNHPLQAVMSPYMSINIISPFVFESSGLVLCSLCLSFVGHVGWLLCQSTDARLNAPINPH